MGVVNAVRVTASAVALMMVGFAVAASDAGSAPRPVYTDASVEWLVPAAAPAQPQTPEAAERGKQFGRKLPTPEALQPTLDAALTAYQPRSDVKLSGTFKGASSDVLPGLVNAWIKAFSSRHPKVSLNIAPPYAGSLGAKELVKKTLDFVFVSRELKPEDLVDFRAKFGYDPLSVPVAGGSYRHFGFLDAMAFFVHPDNPLTRLDFDQLDSIYSSTRHRGGQPITTWGQLGLTGEWADKPINIYGIQPWNGFEEFIRQRVLSRDDRRGEWREGIRYDKTVFPVAGKVAADRYGLGYSGIAYLDAPVKVLPLAAEKGGRYIAPTYENVALAEYSLSRLIFFNINKPPGRPLPPALDEFLKFILSRDGQQVVRDQGIFLPLRAQQAAASRALLNAH